MQKKLHLLLAFLLLAGIAQAQLPGLGRHSKVVLPEIPASALNSQLRFEQLPHFTPRRAAIEIDRDRQLWWGYYPDAQISSIALGSQSLDTYWAAIGIPASEALPKGKNIKAVRFALAGTPTMKNFHLWISDKLPRSLADVMTDIPIATEDLVNQGFTEVPLPQDIAVPTKTLYVGYTFEVTELTNESTYPVIIRYNGANIDESSWLMTPSLTNGEWTDQFKSSGPIAIHVLLDGDFPHNAVEVSPNFLDVFGLPNGTAEATVTLTSKGLGEVRSIDYIVGDANTEEDEQHLEFEPINGLDAQTTVRIPMKADATLGRTIRYISITKVNGVDNNVNSATAEGYFVTLSEAVPRKTVVEEFTGTWCGWCPRGVVGMEKINERFGDKAITIVVHSGDPMEINYGASAPSYPYAYVDRGIAADPYTGVNGQPAGICDLVADRNATLAEASVNLQQPTLAKNGSITFKTDITFYYDNSKAPYAIGYVLVADGLKGKGKSWAQANYYSGRNDYADDVNLKPWINAASYVSMSYDHVAVDAKGMDASLGGISAPIRDGVKRTLSGSFSISGNTVLQNFENLKVVAVLFNTDNGYIVNADIQPVQIADDFSTNRMQVKAFDITGLIKGEIGTVSVPVANFGRAGIRSIDYLVRSGGVDSEEMHLDLPTPITTFGLYAPIDFKIKAPEETGVSSQTFVITKLNGTDNEATSGKNSTGSIITVAKASKRKTVVEEFTGTWCMWCPRGMAGLKRAQDEYPDDAVLIAIHGGRNTEPMQVATFNNQISSISGFPSAHVNRYLSCDPYQGTGSEGWGLGAVIENENNKMVEASVELHQPIMEQSTGIINFTTDVTFQLNRKNAPYLLSYVLVADGLTGTGDDWTQINAYAAYYPGVYGDEDPYMREICDEWEVYQSGLIFNHVGIAALGIDNGVTGSLKNTVEEGQVQTHTGRIATKNNKLAKLATKMRVIALLYDKTRKTFINADQKEVLVTDAVEDLDEQAESSETARYAIDGKQLTRPTRGINIVRMADGSVHKVLVK